MRVTSAKSAKNARTFKNTWPPWCLKPDKGVTDNDPEFSGGEWEFMLVDWGIRKGTIFSCTPTADAIIESSHQVIRQILCTMLHGTTVRTKAELEAAFDDACTIATRFMRSVFNIALQGDDPGMLAFGQFSWMLWPSLPTDSHRQMNA